MSNDSVLNTAKPVKHQATNTTYSAVSTNQEYNRNIVDLTTADDNEVILMPSIMLSDIACDISGASRTLDDIGHLFYMISQNEITVPQTIAMSRLAHDSVNTWKEILCSQLGDLNKPLAQTNFGKMEGVL